MTFVLVCIFFITSLFINRGLVNDINENWKWKKTGEFRLSHHIDLKTGIYNGKQIIDPKK